MKPSSVVPRPSASILYYIHIHQTLLSHVCVPNRISMTLVSFPDSIPLPMHESLGMRLDMIPDIGTILQKVDTPV